MRLRLFLAPVIAAAALLAPAAPASAATGTGTTTVAVGPVTAGAATPANECSAGFHGGDPRLGPQDLPRSGPVGRELTGYRRTGGLTEEKFLATYYSPTANSGSPGWIYPPSDGYVLRPDGTPVEFTVSLLPGQDIDRYGSEYGSFLAPEGIPYAARSIPPQSLDGNPAAGCNYRDYRVLKPFTVHAGPIAPWFGQPGYGLQYQLDGALVLGAPTRLNVLWLVDNGYLARLN
ncbi:TNT domain-containing protein [Kitasatospora sp. NPDC056138]|uniref:TNT domain-containing protein n=1 Tax=Kitasatospora sp. NPDC056138 TaxID=3345724 RepID=UPI0035D95E15